MNNIIGGRKVAQPQYIHQEFPKCVDTVVDGKIVGILANDEAEELAAKKAVAALSTQPTTTQSVEPSKDELLEKLVAAGVEVDKRWGAERLKAELSKLAG